MSSGRDNNELIDNLMRGKYIRSAEVENVFRALDRADYMSSEVRDQAYKDLAWRNGSLHMSAPCIYSEVMEALELKTGLTFLNVGSGTGYLNTLVGLIIGTSGINHGIEVNSFVVDYSNKKLSHFIENSPTLDEFDFCEPKFFCGNGLCLAPLQSTYDRVYCGAGCPYEYQNYFKQLIKVGGILVMPLNDNLIQVKRVSPTEWTTKNLLHVSFASLKVPTKEESTEHVKLDELCPVRLQALSRGAVRNTVRAVLVQRRAELRTVSAGPPPRGRRVPRRIRIPFDDSDAEELNSLHDLDRESGANEMNALLNLVLSMGQNRVAGALRFDSIDASNTSEEEGDRRASGRSGGEEDSGENEQRAEGNEQGDEPPAEGQPSQLELCREIVMFQFRGSRARAPAVDSTQARRSSSRSNSSDRASDSGGNNENDAGNQKPNPSPEKTKESKFKKLRTGSGTSDAEPEPGTSQTVQTESAKTEAAKTDEESSTKQEKIENSVSHSSDADESLVKDSLSTEMEWEEGGKDGSSDEEDTSKDFDKKRQKLDSGIGEENSPGGSSPEKTEPRSDGSDAVQSDRSLEEDDDHQRARPRRPKRSHRDVETRSSSSSSSSEEEIPRKVDRATKKKRRACHAALDVRRLRLSLLLRRELYALPLPPALRHYVNYGRTPPA